MKILIWGFFKFPRMSANANYAQYLALALKDIGYDVTIVSPGNPNICKQDNKGFSYYKGIRFIPLELEKGKIKGFIDYYYTQAGKIIKVIQQLELSSNDIVIGYLPEKYVIDKVYRFCLQRHIIMGNCVDELFGPEQLKGAHFLRKHSYFSAIKKSIPKCDFIISISTYIERYYRKYNCKTFVLPIMADTQEFPYYKITDSDITHFIYPANGVSKDNLLEMLNAVASLPDEHLSKLEFNITGVDQKYIKKYINEKIRKILGKTIIIHEWLEYEQLIELYKKMDFLLLARSINQMTLANFPSKVPEVMTYGVIPIVSKVGDYTKYYLKDGVNSLIFEGSDTMVCTKAIIRALNITPMKKKQLSENARKCAVEKFDYHNWESKLGVWLKDLIQGYTL